MRILFIVAICLSYLLSSTATANDLINICLMQCKNKLQVKLSDQAIDTLQIIFDNDKMSDSEERKCIAKAIALMEKDIYTQISKNISGHDLTEKLSDQISNLDDTKNTRNFLIYLLDNRYIRYHLLRRTQKRIQWLGSTETTSAVKSTRQSTSFAIDSRNTPIAHEPKIIEINSWKKSKTFKGIFY